MCTWITEVTQVAGSGKGTTDWTPLTRAAVYYDHPQHAPLDHALIIDFANESLGTGARVVVELTAASARDLVQAIQSALASGVDAHALA